MIKVLKSGFYTSVQDRGRKGFGSIGVPISGVMDSYSANIANSVLKNSLENAVLEITFGGCEFEFTNETIICISGANFLAKINNEPITLNSRIKVNINDVLSFGKIVFGVRCYLAVKGGFLTNSVLKSRSFYQNITEDFLIKKDDLLPIESYISDLRPLNAAVIIDELHFVSNKIGCYKGPEFDLLDEFQKKEIETHIFTISNNNNRMGYRLNEIVENKIPSILTSAVIPGTVQLTPSGKLIILMRDCQVTGGYPRVLQLTDSGINQMAQKTTNNLVKFILYD